MNVRFVGLHEGLLEYRCEDCGAKFHLKPYERVKHEDGECEGKTFVLRRHPRA